MNAGGPDTPGDATGSRVLVVGWFSYAYRGATAGDLMAKDVVCQWLSDAGYSFDVALAEPFDGGVDWQSVVPSDYSDLVFVCGPFSDNADALDVLERFGDCQKIGINLTMMKPLGFWNPFDVLLERDSDFNADPDISIVSGQPKVPVVGLVLVEPQLEYGDRARHEWANAAIERLVQARQMAVVKIDTRLDRNDSGLRSAAEVELVIARMDLVISTRLHGMVLALKNGVPVIAVDPIAGGAKITRQAEVLGWPILLNAASLNDADLQEAFDWCRSPGARGEARARADAARSRVHELRDSLLGALAGDPAARPTPGVIRTRSELRFVGGPPTAPHPAAILGVACVRNENLRLPHFLDHHRELGVERFFIVDNGSTDGSTAFLLGQPDVHVFTTDQSYAAARYGVAWINEILDTHALGHWALILDADELFTYPDSENLDLQTLTARFDRVGAETVRSFMLDMYADRPIRDTAYQRGQPLIAAAPFFDADTYWMRDGWGVPSRGGPRFRLFWRGRAPAATSPWLTKFPLIRWRKGLSIESIHNQPGVVQAPTTGVLLHFKLMADLYQRAQEEVSRKQHWQDASEYAVYWDVLRSDPAVSAYHEGSQRYEGTSQLAELGLIREHGAGFDATPSTVEGDR